MYNRWDGRERDHSHCCHWNCIDPANLIIYKALSNILQIQNRMMLWSENFGSKKMWKLSRRKKGNPLRCVSWTQFHSYGGGLALMDSNFELQNHCRVAQKGRKICHRSHLKYLFVIIKSPLPTVSIILCQLNSVSVCSLPFICLVSWFCGREQPKSSFDRSYILHMSGNSTDFDFTWKAVPI